MTGNVIYQEFEREIDGKTGEVLRENSKEVLRHPAEPPYVKLYIDDLCLLAEVPEALKKTLMLLLRKLDYDGYITLSQRYRELVCEKLNISSKTLRNRLTQLVSKKLLLKDGINEYQANPFYFARGNWRSIIEQRQAFQMKITYTERGKKIETVKAPSNEGAK